MENLDDMYANSDADGETWREFTAAWWEQHHDAELRVSDLVELCEKTTL